MKRKQLPAMSSRGRFGRGSLACRLFSVLAAASILSVALAEPEPPAAAYVRPRGRSAVEYRLGPLAEGLRLPVDAVPLDDTGALLLVALDGVIQRYQDGAVDPQYFLSLAGRVTGLMGEQGLFSVALEPAERANARGTPRHLIAAFTERGTNDLVVAAYPVLPDLSGAEASEETVLLRIRVPEPFHHGGHVAFGPDGMLYVSVGDGQRNPRFLYDHPHPARDLGSLRGKVLRIDPFPLGSDEPYAIPADNPFTAANDPEAAAAGARGEVWAYGFRNPWKFTFAPSDGAIILSDVGEDTWEEIDVVVKGGDHGWPAREGPTCLAHPDTGVLVVPDCAELDLVPPVAYYGHPNIDPEGGFSVTGGTVVADAALPDLLGKYVFGDFITGRLWSLDLDSGEVVLLLQTARPVSGIVDGPKGEVLVLGIDGTLARLAEAR
ncbi:MAG TPA: PQQ-dependent sugar dehydrogenase [Trueperaceae bacterium]|nr:PQQ-dependent sugar dehydrogenase [Trueperaceae bacterium]